jgi:16S rRNA (adenine1518-N6/adenine1519-N6)-dimethyltransferase
MYEANKKLGQNFLTDLSVPHKMVENVEVSNNEDIIEIGPGLGVVTAEIIKLVKNSNLYIVEIDERFVHKLKSDYASKPQVEIINEDILKFLPKFTSNKPVKIIGSLPYYITSPIIHAIIKMNPMPQKAVILIQKEVGKKLCASAPDASYLSTLVQTFYNVTYVQTVPSIDFSPQPEVDGAVVVLDKKFAEKWEPKVIDRYEGFLHRAFKNPRKMLNKAFSKEELVSSGIDPTLRPGAVPVERWVEAFKVICPI